MKDRPGYLEPYFDFLKAFAITGVFAYHAYDFNYDWGSVPQRISEGILHNLFANASSLADYLEGLAQLWFALGSVGIEIFLLASGFGLYLSYLRRKTPWRQFYMKRALRILPLYWAALLLLYFARLIEPRSLKVLAYHFLLIQNFTPYYLSFGALWFVGYIAFIYLLFTLLVKVFKDTRAKWAFFAISLFITPLFMRIMGHFGFQYLGGDLPTKYLPVFLLGMLLAEAYHEEKTVFLNPLSSLCALFLVGVLIIFINKYPSLYPYLKLALGALLFWGMYIVYKAVSSLSPLRKIVHIMAYGSYSIFLLHVGLLFLMLRALTSNPARLEIFKAVTFNSPLGVYIEYYALLVIFCFYLQRSYDFFLRRVFSAFPATAPKPELN
jgi:peptidoglycan/LPS O-acetylase OafA/YrhL